ncbi:MAG: hypothetical protein ABJN51_08150 [Sneathiella sp.]
MPIAAVSLAACNVNSLNAPDPLMPFDASILGEEICYFSKNDSIEETVFAFDKVEKGKAYVGFMDESIELIASTPLEINEGGFLSGIYVPSDEPDWEIRISGMYLEGAKKPFTYGISLELWRDGELIFLTPATGQCEL